MPTSIIIVGCVIPKLFAAGVPGCNLMHFFGQTYELGSLILFAPIIRVALCQIPMVSCVH